MIAIAGPLSGSLPLAVHIADGVLSWPWLLVGFVLAAALAGAAGVGLVVRVCREHEEEIPRLALLTAAFFVASSLHLKLGPTSVHLLLNGLVGVVLGWRAPLAILIGVTLQALLIPHGGLTTIGVNTCTEAIPALLAGALFGILQRLSWRRHRLFRGVLVGVSAFVWGGALVFGAMVLCTNPLGAALTAHTDAGLIVAVNNLEPAWLWMLHPAVPAVLALFAVAVAVFEGRMGNAPEFPLGLLVGGLAVLATTALTGLILLADGADRWHSFVTVVFLAHLPLALLEGLVVGCTVGFLARVKPELLGTSGETTPALSADTPAAEEVPPDPVREAITAPPAPLSLRPPVLLLALGGMLLFATAASAHRLKASFQVDAAGHQVRVESYYETEEIPEKATAKVFRSDGSVLTEGPLDDNGRFVFRYDRPDNLRVAVDAPGGHRAEVKIPREALEEKKDTPKTVAPGEYRTDGKAEELGERRTGGERFRDLAVGVSLVLSVASFLLSVLNSWRLRASSRPGQVR
jgi:cobalt/nickel transport system permease protein